MNRKSVIATLKSVCLNSFKNGVISPDTKMGYIEVFERPYDSNQIIITEEGFWGVEGENKILLTPKNSDQFYVFYLLLYTPIHEIIKLMKNGLNSHKLPEKIAYTFPYDELIIAALKGSHNWGALAMKWLDQGYPINDEIQLCLCKGDKQSKYWLKWQEQRLKLLIGI